jgi:N6-L-threonylcarbamoyladenine synthase
MWPVQAITRCWGKRWMMLPAKLLIKRPSCWGCPIRADRHSQRWLRAASPGQYKVLGQTLDDSAGEAFDKTAKLLDLPYPGGPVLAELATRGQSGRFKFPRPMLKKPGLEFSFSGLKTAVMLAVRQLEENGPLTESDRADIAKSFEEAVVETLVVKSARAITATGYKSLVVAGGVGANRSLRAELGRALQEQGAEVYYPRPELCTDNGAMIAHLGLLRLQAGHISSGEVMARPRWELEELQMMTMVAA